MLTCSRIEANICGRSCFARLTTPSIDQRDVVPQGSGMPSRSAVESWMTSSKRCRLPPTQMKVADVEGWVVGTHCNRSCLHWLAC